MSNQKSKKQLLTFIKNQNFVPSYNEEMKILEKMSTKQLVLFIKVVLGFDL